jgi:hypothetical protein
MFGDPVLGKVPQDTSYANAVITNSLVVCEGSFSRQLTIPQVMDIQSALVKPRGSIAYDIATNSIWYSDGNEWFPVAAMGNDKQLLDSITIYVNAQTGSDDNNGLSSETAVFSVQSGLDIMGTFLAREGILQLEGSVPFDFGDNAVLNFFPAAVFMGSITVRGTPSNTIQDTVASITNIGPFDTWNRITGISGNYPVSAYAQSFIRNDTTNRVFAVEDNAAGTVDTIAGNDVFSGNVPAWTVGDTFTLLQIRNVLQFSGLLVLETSNSANITFEL